MKNILILGGIVLALLAGAAWLARSPTEEDSTTVSTNGLHWHPRLEIYVKGEQITIPPNTGLGAVHRPIHTHEDLPLIHLEFEGRVAEDDIMLGRFFEVWGNDMRSFGTNMKMTVNGVESTEFENYLMKDKDVIILQYD